MTSLKRQTRICALCGAPGEQWVLQAPVAAGPPDFDTRPASPLREMLPHWVMRCPHCGYCAPDVAEAAPEAAAVVRDGAYQEMLRDPARPPKAREFLACASILEALGEYAMAGWSALHAAWSCDDAGAAEAAVQCRRQALALWRKGKQRGLSFGEDHATEFALVADLHRRSGEFEAAREACAQALREPGLPEIIERMLRRQLVHIQQRDTGPHSLSEIPEPPPGAGRVVMH